ncbi:MAG TPA: FtsX-like permease family protein [Pyrinomonadaceae bacterium]|nr:FtsX-like permease family protein [Pyrinomonadaceae bacterium]
MISLDEKIGAATNSKLNAAASEGSDEPAGGRKRRRRIAGLQFVAFALGLALFVYVVNRVGVQSIFDTLARIGLGFFVLLCVSGTRHFFRAVPMYLAVPPGLRRFNLWQAFTTRLSGEAISFLTFTGPILGEATKAALLRKRMPLVTGVQALVVDNLLYNLSVALFILSGACVMLASYNLPDAAHYTLLLIATLAMLTLLAVGLAASRRVMPLTWLLELLAARGFEPRALARRRSHINELESNVYDFYRHRRGSFFLIVAFDLLAHVSSVLEVYLTLRLLGFRPGFDAPYVIESLTKVINFVFGFVPATIGVYEGGTEVILRTLGFAAATGITLALVRKAGMIFWTAVGLGMLATGTLPAATRRTIERHPRLQKAMDNLVLSNIAHRPARTLVSVVGIAVGVLLIVFTVGLAHGVLRERGRREAGVGAEIMLRASGTVGLSGSQPFALPVSRAAEVARVEGVRAAVPIGQVTGKTGSGFGSRIIDGIDFPQYEKLSGLKIIEGRALGTGGDEVIVDTEWIKDRKLRVGDTEPIYDRPFRIVGIYEPPGGARIKIPLATMQEQVGSEASCTSILVAAVNPAEQDALAERIHRAFPEDQIIFTRDLPELYATGVPALNVFINVVVAIAAAISMLVILLAMYTTVTERTRQIGILKSLGMSNTMIAWVIEQEALLVSLLGVALGLVLTFAARFALMRVSSLTVEIEPRWVLISLLIGVVGGSIGALYPALRAARQDAVDALSYE